MFTKGSLNLKCKATKVFFDAMDGIPALIVTHRYSTFSVHQSTFSVRHIKICLV